MQTPAEIREQLKAVCDAVVDILRCHEEEAHDGEPCASNRLSTLAYLAHSLGFKATADNLFSLITLLAYYDASCPRHSCPAHPSETTPEA